MSKKKLISIIIPFYGQTVEQLALPLGAINGQIGVDFSQIDVHLVNDAGEKIDASAFQIFQNLNIKMHDLEKNSGPGVARQYGVDHSEGEYIMFVDADDLMGGPGVLLEFINAMKPGIDFICSAYVEETKANDKFSYILHPATGGMGAVYSKLFQRKMLLDNGIKFHPDLRIFEDQYYINLVSTFSKGRANIEQPAYIWRFSPTSLFRNKLTNNVDKTEIYARSLRYQLEFFRSKGLTNLTQFTLIALLKIYRYQKSNGSKGSNQTELYKECRQIAKQFLPLQIMTREAVQTLAEAAVAKDSFYAGISKQEIHNYFAKIID